MRWRTKKRKRKSLPRSWLFSLAFQLCHLGFQSCLVIVCCVHGALQLCHLGFQRSPILTHSVKSGRLLRTFRNMAALLRFLIVGFQRHTRHTIQIHRTGDRSPTTNDTGTGTSTAPVCRRSRPCLTRA